MKFARYLEDTQIPEWKKAYIDYRGLKKKIAAIRRSNEDKGSDSRKPRSSITESSPNASVLRRRNYGAVGRTPPNAFGRTPPSTHARTPSSVVGRTSEAANSPPGAHQATSPISEHVRTPPAAANRSVKSARFRLSTDELGPDFQLPPAMSSIDSLKDGTISSHAPSIGVERRRALPSRVFSGTLSAVPSRNSTTLVAPHEQTEPNVLPDTISAPASVLANINTEPKSTPRNPFSGVRRRFTTASRHNDVGRLPPATVQELLAGSGPNELAFFTALDQEIEKARQWKSVESFYLERERDAELKVAALKEQFHELRGHKQLSSGTNEGLWPGFLHLLDSINITAIPMAGQTNTGKSADASAKSETPLSNPQTHVATNMAHDPDAYHRAKKKLKKAVLEFYRGLELLQNYRILNMTGFRKGELHDPLFTHLVLIMRFHSAQEMSSQNLYMREKVETCSFASGDTCDRLLKEIERIYATRFEKGDEKKARIRLRATARQSTHHFSTFRSGMLVGLALPALAMGIYYSLQEEQRDQIPEWAALLQVYAALCIPVIFSLLLGLNMVAWARARINFIFIFELDARTVIDAREYTELPAFLFATLAYAFWLSFSRAGAETVAPTTWPVIWLSLAAAVLFSPFRIFHRSARWWLLRTVGKLFVSGRTRVEFRDFWMGDQFCSLVYTMGNLYFLVCAYTGNWYHIEQRCQLGPHWTIPLVLTALPSFIRLVQCIRRYIDSKNHIHLINGGKYTASIVSYVAYYGWRHYGSQRDFRMGVWILFATINSCYTSYWDLMMDWSVLQIKGVQYKLLRKELAYSNHIPAYYVAIVTNVVLRFIWVWYIPSGGLPAGARAFMFAVLEMLRRVQWNFFRLENEHIGNADQFRVTREVPLPYVFTGDRDSDDEDHGLENPKRKLSVRLPVISKKDEDDDVEAEGR